MSDQQLMYFGTESEFAVLGSKAARGHFARELHALCLEHFPALPSDFMRPDLYLPWGRLYIDAGLHPEWCTAEVTDPWSVVYFQKVGEAVLSSLTEKCTSDISISRHNVDCLSQTTWGTHESYQVSCRRFERYARTLIPHLVTRTLYTGAGGIDINVTNKTCHYLISPRAGYYRSVFDVGSQSNRPLFHLKDESLSRESKRLHLICGENLYSHTAGFLKIATTALLILLTDHLRTMPVCDIISDDMLESLRRLSADPFISVRYRTRKKDPIRPLDIQWRYLEFVYSKVDQDFMPPWARFACELWHKTLNALEKGWPGVCRMLDWAARLDYLEKKLNALGNSFLHYPFGNGLSTEQLYELLELDLSFSKIGPDGLFHQLEKQGVFEHHVQGVPEIKGSDCFDFPVQGRAAVRAGVIERLGKGKVPQYLASWSRIVKANQQSILDLGSVDCKEENWIHKEPDHIGVIMHALKTKLNEHR